MLLSIVIPAKNEAASIGKVVSAAREAWPDAEVIVVDDGSTDDTGEVAEAAGASLVTHPESLGDSISSAPGPGDADLDPLELSPLLNIETPFQFPQVDVFLALHKFEELLDLGGIDAAYRNLGRRRRTGDHKEKGGEANEEQRCDHPGPQDGERQGEGQCHANSND